MAKRKKGVTLGAFKIKTFEAAPEEFNPLTASQKRLAYHGIVPRPDKEKEPELYKAWHKVYSKKLHHIVPEFVMNERKQHRPVKNRQNKKDGSSTSSNWSGVVVNSPASDSFAWIIGNWIVPDPNQPSGMPTGSWYYSSAWVGIDGDGSNDVLQAGTDSDVLVQNGTVHKQVSAWWEWYPDYSVTINNFPVSSGDYMTCLICSSGTTAATVYLTNISTGTHTSFNITAPGGTTLKGNCAEWILEAPTVGGSQANLAEYGATFFDQSYAFTKKSVLVNAGTGNTINMVNSANNIISDATIEGTQLLKTNYV